MNIKNNTRKLVMVSMFIALSIILKRILGIEISSMQRIGFSFIPAAICGAVFGPLTAGLAGAIGDFLGYLLKPTGEYLVGYSLTSFLAWATYGVFFYNQKISFVKVVMASLLVGTINLFTGTLWLSSFLDTPYVPLLLTRLQFQLILVGVRIVVLAPIMERLTREIKRMAQTT